jgi:N-acetylneuraminic acid mutarotase
MVWTGYELLVWGGQAYLPTANGSPFVYYNDGARYNPATDTWVPMSGEGAPGPMAAPQAVWTGQEMIVWGRLGDGVYGAVDGARYDPRTDRWSPLSLDSLDSLMGSSKTVWTGTEMIIWGANARDSDPSAIGIGMRWDPQADTWTATPTAAAPSSRRDHVAVWASIEMIVWGGNAPPNIIGSEVQDGGGYNPATDTWMPTSLVGAPSERYDAQAVWTGRDMIVWGGRKDLPSTRTYLLRDDGGAYDPETRTWRVVPPAPLQSRQYESVIWTGTEMVVWGGSTEQPPSGTAARSLANDGARYLPGCQETP